MIKKCFKENLLNLQGEAHSLTNIPQEKFPKRCGESLVIFTRWKMMWLFIYSCNFERDITQVARFFASWDHHLMGCVKGSLC